MVDKPVDAALDDVVEAALASSRTLVALSARSIASVPGVTLPQYRMLVVLERGRSNLTALARELDVASSTALRMVDRLIDAGLVERHTPPENRRETHLSLTPVGRRTVHNVTNRRRKELRTVIARIPANQRAALVDAMSAFAAAAEPGSNHP